MESVSVRKSSRTELLRRNYIEDLDEETIDNEDIEDDNVTESVEMRPLISIPKEGGVEMIINIKEWLKSPWSLEQE